MWSPDVSPETATWGTITHGVLWHSLAWLTVRVGGRRLTVATYQAPPPHVERHRFRYEADIISTALTANPHHEVWLAGAFTTPASRQRPDGTYHDPEPAPGPGQAPSRTVPWTPSSRPGSSSTSPSCTVARSSPPSTRTTHGPLAVAPWPRTTATAARRPGHRTPRCLTTATPGPPHPTGRSSAPSTSEHPVRAGTDRYADRTFPRRQASSEGRTMPQTGTVPGCADHTGQAARTTIRPPRGAPAARRHLPAARPSPGGPSPATDTLDPDQAHQDPRGARRRRRRTLRRLRVPGPLAGRRARVPGRPSRCSAHSPVTQTRSTVMSTAVKRLDLGPPTHLPGPGGEARTALDCSTRPRAGDARQRQGDRLATRSTCC